MDTLYRRSSFRCRFRFGLLAIGLILESGCQVLPVDAHDDERPEQVVVMSAPQCSSWNGERPRNLPVMTKLEWLRRRDCEQRIRYSFDFQGSTADDPRDCNIDFSEMRATQSSYWFKGYREAQKKVLLRSAQDGVHVAMIAIEGGPVSAAEADALPGILEEALRDAEQLELDVRASYAGTIPYREFSEQYDLPVYEICEGNACLCDDERKLECVDSWRCGHMEPCRGRCGNASWRLSIGDEAPPDVPQGAMLIVNQTYGHNSSMASLLDIIAPASGSTQMSCAEIARRVKLARWHCVRDESLFERVEKFARTKGCNKRRKCAIDPDYVSLVPSILLVGGIVCLLLLFIGRRASIAAALHCGSTILRCSCGSRNLRRLLGWSTGTISENILQEKLLREIGRTPPDCGVELERTPQSSSKSTAW